MMASGFLVHFSDFLLNLNVVFGDGGSFIGSAMTLVLYPVSLVLMLLKFVVVLVLNLLGIVLFYLGYLPSIALWFADIDFVSIGDRFFDAIGYGPDVLSSGAEMARLKS